LLGGHLPSYLTRLVGRQAELNELLALLESARLLTLTGPGGSGKTRLAAAVAAHAQEESGRAAWWVKLAHLTDSEFVAEQALRAVGSGDLPARPHVETMALTLQGPSLLVLDNCEQVVDGCVALVTALLARCPELVVLATSRRPLAVAGEQVFRLSGLPYDGDSSGAVELFLARAQEHGAPIDLDKCAPGQIREVCELLDGLPLAIELAASRMPTLTPAEILDRVKRDMSVLKRTGADQSDRQGSIDATLEWSHRLLGDHEQIVFRRLAAFRGSFDLDAVEAVTAAGAIRRADVLDALDELVHQSLVEVARNQVGARYHLLLSVRRYAEERLERSGELQETRRRHAAWYQSILDEADGELMGPDQVPWLHRLEEEHANLRVALDWSLTEDPETAGRLVAGLWQFWYRRGYYHEGRRWLERAVDAVGSATPLTRAAVLVAAGAFAHLQCDYGLASRRLQRGLGLQRRLGDERGAAATLQRLGSVAREQARYRLSLNLHNQSMQLWRRLDDEVGVADSLHYLGFASLLAGELERAADFCSQALDRFEVLGAKQDLAAIKVNLGALAHYQGDAARAVVLLDEARELSEDGGYQEGLAWALHERGVVAVHAYELSLAAELFVESLRLHFGLGDQWRSTRVVEDIAGALVAATDPGLAAALLGATDAARARMGAPVPKVERPMQEEYLRSLRRALSHRDFAEYQARGRELSLEQVVEQARDAANHFSMVAGRQGMSGLLSPRERAVLEMVGQGRTNREIGQALSISTSTVGVHVSNVLRKLNVGRRVEAVTRAQRLGLIPEAGVEAADKQDAPSLRTRSGRD
jgi:predicted ATPase/DNA-binding CsgD family transcriptional regulator